MLELSKTVAVTAHFITAIFTHSPWHCCMLCERHCNNWWQQSVSCNFSP